MIEGNNGDQLEIVETGGVTAFFLLKADGAKQSEISDRDAWKWFVGQDLPSAFLKFVQ